MAITIKTEHVYPPIPDRRFDYAATMDGYEPGDPIGTGRTQEAAVIDLDEQIDERDRPTPTIPERIAALRQICMEMCEGCRLSWRRDREGRHHEPMPITCEAPTIRAHIQDLAQRRAPKKEPA